MSPILSAIVFGMIAAGVAISTLVLVQRAAGFTRRNGPVAAAFAGGLVITIAVTHLIPEALTMTANAPWLVLAGFGFGFVVHSLLGAGAHEHAHDHNHPPAAKTINPISAVAPVVAIALHSALDGLIYSVTFAVNAETAIIAATGLIIHEFPEALICFVLLQRAGLSNMRAMVFAFLASGATTFGAAAISAPYANLLDTDTLGILFAVVAGLLLHVGAAHLIHEAGEAGALKGGTAVFAGAAVAAVMAVAHGHSHDHTHAHGHDHAHDDPHDGGHGHGLDAAEIHDHSEDQQDHSHDDHDHEHHDHDHP